MSKPLGPRTEFGYGPDDAQPVLQAPVGKGGAVNALLVLFDQLYAAELNIVNGATASAAVLAVINDANAAVRASANAEVPQNGGDATLTTDSRGDAVWDADPSRRAYVRVTSVLRQQMMEDAAILKAFNTAI